MGFGLWAKYALLHVMLPLVALFFLVPEWRRQIVKPGPWLAVLLCTAIIAPHIADTLAKGATPLQFAVHSSPASFGQRLGWAAEFALNCALSQICMAGLAAAAAGLPALAKAWRQLRDWRTATRFEQFLNVAAVAPVAIVVFAAFFEVKPHFLWQTPFNVGFAAFWGHAAAHAGTQPNIRRLARVYAALACLFIVSFVIVREVAPLTLHGVANQELNGPELATLAERYWAKRHNGKIQYIVSLNKRFGFQAAGSITFDLPYRVNTLEDGDPKRSAWIDVEALKREGALVVMTQPPAPGQSVLGQPIVNVETFARPVLRGARPPAILFGELQGTGKQAAN